MAVRDDLETALRVAWNPDDLAVYGDELLAVNDPRGELVALDLQPTPNLRSWHLRRTTALKAWLGGDLAERAGAFVQHGFVYEFRDGYHPPALLDGPLGGVIRGFTTWGRARVARSLARLARRPRPWLRRLAIAYWDREPLGDRLRADLIAATPILEQLVLVGEPAFDAFPHPALRTAEVSDRDATVFARDVELRTVAVADGGPGPAIARGDIAWLLELVDGTSDCNLVHAQSDGFAEPVPALLVRLAAAGLITLDGPIARIATADRELASWRGYGAPEAAPMWAYLQIDVPREARMTIEADPHRQLIAAAMDRFPLAERVRAELAQHLALRSISAADGDVVDRMRSRCLALNCLLELRGLWDAALSVGDEAPWRRLEDLVSLLSTENAQLGLEMWSSWEANPRFNPDY